MNRGHDCIKPNKLVGCLDCEGAWLSIPVVWEFGRAAMDDFRLIMTLTEQDELTEAEGCRRLCLAGNPVPMLRAPGRLHTDASKVFPGLIPLYK